MWQPIETAPFDVRILVGAWINGHWYCQITIGRLGRPGPLWPYLGKKLPHISKPTHWHNLPEPPNG